MIIRLCRTCHAVLEWRKGFHDQVICSFVTGNWCASKALHMLLVLIAKHSLTDATFLSTSRKKNLYFCKISDIVKPYAFRQSDSIYLCLLHVPFSIRRCCHFIALDCVYVRNMSWHPFLPKAYVVAMASPCPYLALVQLMCYMSNEIGHFFNGSGGIWHLDSCRRCSTGWGDFQELTSEAKLRPHSSAVCVPSGV